MSSRTVRTPAAWWVIALWVATYLVLAWAWRLLVPGLSWLALVVSPLASVWLVDAARRRRSNGR